VELVFEHIGGEVFTQSLACLVPGGRMAVCGAHAGEVVPLDIIEFFRREIDLLGSFRATSTELRQVFSLVVEGRLRPVIHAAFPLVEAAEAHRVMERREHFGKLLLVP
jgi:NADPH:quinone reductase-like Zn-dependent oxidoreductase